MLKHSKHYWKEHYCSFQAYLHYLAHGWWTAWVQRANFTYYSPLTIQSNQCTFFDFLNEDLQKLSENSNFVQLLCSLSLLWLKLMRSKMFYDNKSHDYFNKIAWWQMLIHLNVFINYNIIVVNKQHSLHSRCKYAIKRY